MATPETDMFRIVTTLCLLYDPDPKNGRNKIGHLINLYAEQNPSDQETIKRHFQIIFTDVSKAVSAQIDELDD